MYQRGLDSGDESVMVRIMSAHEELTRLAHDWDRAMVENDADAIGSYMCNDWTIVDSDGSIGSRKDFLDFVRSGDLTHDRMETHDSEVRVYGDSAVMIARGVSGGNYRGQSFLLTERVTCVFVRIAGKWLCAHTHRSRRESQG